MISFVCHCVADKKEKVDVDAFDFFKILFCIALLFGLILFDLVMGIIIVIVVRRGLVASVCLWGFSLKAWSFLDSW